jgi:hypothetical protein
VAKNIKGNSAALHRLTVREVQTAGEGDCSDGGGLLLRIRGASCSWVYRFTSAAGRRCEMGLGVARRGSAAQAGQSLTGAREAAHRARELLRQGVDPIDQRESKREAAKGAEHAKKVDQARERLTLARAARAYHERAIEPRMTTKHAAQWIASLENHVPPALWDAPIGSIAAPALLAALSGVRSMEKRDERVPETLRRVRQRLDAVFEDAIFHGHCASNPARAVQRKMRETLPAVEAGEFRSLGYREAPAFMARLRDAEGIAPRCLEFATLTAARTGEAIGATWPEFDLDAALWVIPKERMKAPPRGG